MIRHAEGCWHFCRDCRKDWSHVITKFLLRDSFFARCPKCIATRGLATVAKPRPRRSITGSVEAYSLALPTTREAAIDDDRI
jgi:hypothetical protein